MATAANLAVIKLKTRLLSLDDLDKRTRTSQRVAALIDEISADLGGSENLSAMQRELVQRSAMLSAVAADVEARWLMGAPIDAVNLATISNALRRLLGDLGLERRARDITPILSDYLEGNTVETEAAE